MAIQKLFNYIGILGGLATAIVGVSHLWPLVTPTPGYNSMLHALTSWVLLPLGLTIAIRDADRADLISSPSAFMGSHFSPIFDLLASDQRYFVVLVWAGLTCASFDGIYGILGFVLLLARAGTLLDFVMNLVQKIIDTLEERGIRIPGITNPPPQPTE